MPTITEQEILTSNIAVKEKTKIILPFEYAEDEIPLVTKSRSGAVGSYEYKTRFVVIGGGTVAVSISDKG